MKKRTILLLVTLLAVIVSYFLPYVEIELYVENAGFFRDTEDVDPKIIYESGLELGYPLIAFPGFLIVFLLISIARNKTGNILALVLSCLNIFLVLFILFLLHFNLMSLDMHQTGIGFYVLTIAQLVLVCVSIYNLARPSNRPIKRTGEELLDDLL